MSTVRFDLYVHIGGEVDVDDKPDTPNDLLDAIFPDGWEGEVYDVTTCPRFCSEGYMEVSDDGEEEDEE